MTNMLAKAIRISACVALALAAGAGAANAQDRERDARDRSTDFRWERSLSNGSVVRAHNLNGDILVTPSTNGRVEIVGIRHGASRNSDMKVQVVDTRDGITVCVVWEDADNECDEDGYHSRGRRDDDRDWRSRGSMDLEIRIPADVRIAANSVSGDVSVIGARGEVRANSVSGDIRLERLHASSVVAHTVSGEVMAHIEELTGRGDLSFKSVSGDVTIELPRDINADVSMTTVSGDMQSDFQLTLGGRMSRRRIEARIGQGGRELDVTTVSGDVRLKTARS
jgi:hypothetical protein